MAAYQHANRLPCPTHASPLQWHPRTPPHCLARVLAPHCTPAHNTRTHREHRNYTRGQGVYGAQTAHACGLHGSARIYGPGCRVWAQVRAMCSPGPVGASLSRCPLLLLSRARRVNLPAHRTFLPLCKHTGTTSNYAGTCVLFKCKVQTGKAAQRACVRAVLRCKGEGLHLDMSGLGTAAI